MRVIIQNDEELVARHYPLYVWAYGGVAAALAAWVAGRILYLTGWDPTALICPLAPAGAGLLLLAWPTVTLTLDRATAEVRVERKNFFGRRTWAGQLEDLAGTELVGFQSAVRKGRVMYRLKLLFEQGQPVTLDIADSDENLNQVQEAVGRFIRLVRMRWSRS